MKGNATRAEIVRIGAEIIGQGGFNATGLDAVLKRAKVPKGSFYYYFSSKDDFGLAVIEQAARETSEVLDGFLGDTKSPPLTRLRRFLEDAADHTETSQCKKGCLIGNLGQELASQSEKFRKRIDEVFRGWQEKVAAVLSEAKARGELGRSADPARLAEFVFMGWEGALLRSKVMKSARPMRDFIAILFDKVLK